MALKILDALNNKGRGIMIFHSVALSNISEREIRKELIERNYNELPTIKEIASNLRNIEWE